MLVLESKKESDKLGKSGEGLSDSTRVPKNGVSRSKRLLKPQLLPHQHWGLELRTSLTEAQDDARRISYRSGLRSMNADKMSVATTRPIICMTINIGTDSRAMPAKDSVKLRAIDTAGLAKDVDDVNQ